MPSALPTHRAQPGQLLAPMRSARRRPTVVSQGSGCGHRPLEPFCIALPHGHEDEAWTQLRNVESGSVEQPAVRRVAHGMQAREEPTAVVRELRGGETGTFSRRTAVGCASSITRSASGNKQITFVVAPELLARHGKGRTRDTARDEFDTPVRPGVEGTKIALEDTPRRAVGAQRGAGVRVDLHGGGARETRAFQTDGLAARPRAQFQRGESHDPRACPPPTRGQCSRRRPSKTSSE